MFKLLSRIWGAHALGWASVAALAGIFLSDWAAHRFPVPTVWVSGLTTTAAALWFWRGGKRASALFTMCVAAFGFAHILTSLAHRTVPFLDRIEDGERLFVEVEGVVDDLPRLAGDKEEEGEETGYIVPFRLDSVREIGQAEVWPARVRIRLVGAGMRPQYGDRLRLRGYFGVPKSPRNPGEFDTREYYRTHGMLAEVRVFDPGNIAKLGRGEGHPVVAVAYQARARIEAIVTAGLEDRPVAAATLKAMVLGDREDTPQEIQESFRRSGTMHIFAVSGLHVGIVAWIASQALGLLGFPRRFAALCVIPIVFFYSFVTGFPPSAVRAAIMASIWFLGIALGRKPVLLNTLGAAALVILAGDTFYAFHGGFQLSFIVVASIALLAGPLQKPIRHLINPDPFLPKSLLSPGQKGWYATLQRCADNVSVSLAAWIGSAIPILLFFNIVTPVALIANCFLIPLAVAILGLGAASILVSVVFLGFLSTPLNRTNAHVADAVTWLATVSAEIPYGHFFVELPSWPPEPSPKLTVYDLTSGGAARHLNLGGRKGDWIFDCGDTVSFAGTVRTGLRARGVDEVAGLFLSHRDRDHVSGASALYREMPTRRTIESVPGGGTVNRDVKEAGDVADVTALQLHAGDLLRLSGSKSEATAEILYPPKDGFTRIADDRSAVVLLTCRGWRVLLMGDAGFHTEKWLLARGVDVRCHVLIKNWHASDFSGLPEFLEAAAPRALVASNGTHLAGEAIPPGFADSAQALGIGVIDQAETGAVTILFGEDTLELRPFLAGEPVQIRR